jgi:hypothetical protein
MATICSINGRWGFLALSGSAEVDTVIIAGEDLLAKGRATTVDANEAQVHYLEVLRSFSVRCLGSTPTRHDADGGCTIAEELALITGAAGGIGAEVARSLPADGIPVALYRKIGPVQELAEGLEAAGKQAFALTADVTPNTEVDAAISQALKMGLAYRVPRQRGQVAARRSDRRTPRHSVDKIHAVNAGGVFRVSRAVTVRMIPRGHGAITMHDLTADGGAALGV